MLFPVFRLPQCKVISLVIILYELAPEGFLRQIEGVFACCLDLLVVEVGELRHGILDGVGHLGVVVVRAVYYLNAILNLAVSALHAVCPQTETCEVGGDAGHLECYGLKRGISPWLIV